MSQAKNDLLWLAKRFQGLFDLVPHLEAIDNLNDHIDELKASAEKAKDKVAEALQEHAQVVLDHTVELDNIIAQKDAALKEIKEMKAAARDKVAQTLADAEKKAQVLVSEAAKKVTDAENHLKEVVEKFASVENALHNAEARLKQVEDKITELKGL